VGADRRHVALLRGVNVGGANRLAMADIRALFADAGAADIETYIQSGNVVFSASLSEAQSIGSRVVEGLANRFKIRSPVVLRDAAAWRALVIGNPFLNEGADADTLHAICLDARPNQIAAASLDPDRSPDDSFRLVGADIYLRLANGVARTKLTNAWFDSCLGVVSTGRNWRTVLRLEEMLGA